MQKKAQVMIHTKPKPTEKLKKLKTTKNKSISEEPVIINISAFTVSPVINGNGIHIITRYLGEPVNVCTLDLDLINHGLHQVHKIDLVTFSSE